MAPAALVALPTGLETELACLQAIVGCVVPLVPMACVKSWKVARDPDSSHLVYTAPSEPQELELEGKQ